MNNTNIKVVVVASLLGLAACATPRPVTTRPALGQQERTQVRWLVTHMGQASYNISQGLQQRAQQKSSAARVLAAPISALAKTVKMERQREQQLHMGQVAIVQQRAKLSFYEAQYKAQSHTRYAVRGFHDWSSTCSDLWQNVRSRCYLESTSYATEQCLKGLKQRMRAKPLFKIKVDNARVRFDAKSDSFTVTIPHMLQGAAEVDCVRDCQGEFTSTRPFSIKGGKLRYSQWRQKYVQELKRQVQTWKSFRVRSQELQNPADFERNLILEALVEFKSDNVFVVGDWFEVESIHVHVVGLRAYVNKDGSTWSKTLIRDPKKISNYTCPL